MLNAFKTSFKKLLLISVTAVLFMSLLSYDAFASTFVNNDTGYYVVIEDDANLLSDDEENNLVDEMKEISKYGGVAFHSVDSGYMTTASYAESYYREKFGNGSGVVFLIDMVNRQLYIFSDGEIHKTITSSKANTITDNVYRDASNGNYYNCAKEAFSEISTLLNGGVIAQPMKYICNALLSVLAAMIILFMIANALSKARKASVEKIVEGGKASVNAESPKVILLGETRTYSPIAKSSGHSGGGGGGGHSGGGGGHGF